MSSLAAVQQDSENKYMKLIATIAKKNTSTLTQLLMLLLALSLNACSLLRPAEPRLLAPATLQQQLQLNQTLSSNFDGQQQQILTVVKITHDHLLLLGLSAEGQRLFSLDYDGNTLQQNSLPAVADKLDAERILRLLQLMYWPLDTLQSAYGNDYRILEQGKQRDLMHHDSKIITISYSETIRWQGSATITYHQQPLQLIITTTDVLNL